MTTIVVVIIVIIIIITATGIIAMIRVMSIDVVTQIVANCTSEITVGLLILANDVVVLPRGRGRWGGSLQRVAPHVMRMLVVRVRVRAGVGGAIDGGAAEMVVEHGVEQMMCLMVVVMMMLVAMGANAQIRILLLLLFLII
jgi:hypothetical protein